MLIYVALQAAYILGLLPSQLSGGWAHLGYKNDFGPLAGLASILGLTWLAVLLYADAFVSPADTGLIYTTVTSRISYAMARNGNAPEHLARINRNGVPWISVIVTFFAGLVIFAPFPGWQKLVGFITSATVLSFASGPVVLSSLRRQLPEAPRPFRLPAGDVISYLAFFSSNMIVYWSGWATDFKLFAAVGIGLVVYAAWRAFTRTIAHPAFHWKSFSWVMPWLGCLALISYLGSYDGGRGVITFAIAWPLMAVFSLVIFAWAVAVRLPADRVREHLAEMEHEHQDDAAYPDDVAVPSSVDDRAGRHAT
jgi:amino acid transporter